MSNTILGFHTLKNTTYINNSYMLSNRFSSNAPLHPIVFDKILNKPLIPRKCRRD